MLDKFLKDVVSLVVGKSSESIANLLNTKNYVNEFIIAKKLDLTINQARNILYKLADYGLVSSTRKKDKKKGWYTYFWKIEIIKCLEFLKEVRMKQMNNMNNQIHSRETKQFYVCERCNIEFTEENALLNNFTCNECGEIFTVRDNSKILKDLKKTSLKISEEVKLLEEQLEKENSKIEKEKEKIREKEKKAAKKIREKKKAAKKTMESKSKRSLTPKKKSKKASKSKRSLTPKKKKTIKKKVKQIKKKKK